MLLRPRLLWATWSWKEIHARPTKALQKIPESHINIGGGSTGNSMAIGAQPAGQDTNLCFIKKCHLLADDGPEDFGPVHQVEPFTRQTQALWQTLWQRYRTEQTRHSSETWLGQSRPFHDFPNFEI